MARVGRQRHYCSMPESIVSAKRHSTGSLGTPRLIPFVTRLRIEVEGCMWIQIDVVLIHTYIHTQNSTKLDTHNYSPSKASIGHSNITPSRAGGKKHLYTGKSREIDNKSLSKRQQHCNRVSRGTTRQSAST